MDGFDLPDLSEIQAALIRANFGLFCEAALAPLGQRPAAHHRLIIKELQALSDGRDGRVMLFLPPGSAKSTYASVLFPAWFMGRQKRRQIIGASATTKLAESFSKRAQNMVREMSPMLRYNLLTENVQMWQTTNECQYRSAGIGAVIQGMRFDLAIIDDAIGGYEHANSEVKRENAWNWYNGDVMPRMRPGGRILVINTRWHCDDLPARILESERAGWRVVSIPAQAIENDPLGRAPGEWLWGDDTYGYADLLKAAKARYESIGATRLWAALYQQDPKPAEGSLFKVGKIPDYLDVAPASKQIARGWDLASTAQSGSNNPDFTCGVKLAKLDDGSFVVLDVKRDRGGPDEVETMILGTAREDGYGVKVGIPQDPGQAGKVQVLYLTRKLSGYSIESSPETGDKETRASPVAAQCNVGNLKLVRGPWNAAFVEELAAFPNGAHDDQVDGLARAFAMIGMARGPMKINPDVLRQFGVR